MKNTWTARPWQCGARLKTRARTRNFREWSEAAEFLEQQRLDDPDSDPRLEAHGYGYRRFVVRWRGHCVYMKPCKVHRPVEDPVDRRHQRRVREFPVRPVDATDVDQWTLAQSRCLHILFPDA